MHTTKVYEGTEAEKREQARKDIANWLGIKKFEDTTRAVRACEPKMTWEQFVMMCGIGGIQGYPVEVWAEDCGIEVIRAHPE